MKNKSVLFAIVDDSAEGREFIKRLIKKIYPNSILLEVWSGEEGLEVVINYSPHVILLDYLLPDMSCIEFFHLKEKVGRYLNFPVIALTGQEMR